MYISSEKHAKLGSLNKQGTTSGSRDMRVYNKVAIEFIMAYKSGELDVLVMYKEVVEEDFLMVVVFVSFIIIDTWQRRAQSYCIKSHKMLSEGRQEEQYSIIILQYCWPYYCKMCWRDAN
eukprot:TRINITY_DN122075_c0_g1_i1.p5 TRINITY_DN122075_c0_g1~~TRINITY_DN122075_c0_g1_i1.p5  ORF type:complete len:120 (+),score=0.28 TRINITY_DN122075_c0_g1_i1:780-1139(+)